jgi:hypothetical protein
VVIPVVDTQYRGEVRVELYSPPAFNQFPPSEILVPAFWAQWDIQQPLRAIRVRQGLRLLSIKLDDIAGQAETSGRAVVAQSTNELPTEAAAAAAKHARAASATAQHADVGVAAAKHADAAGSSTQPSWRLFPRTFSTDSASSAPQTSASNASAG